MDNVIKNSIVNRLKKRLKEKLTISELDSIEKNMNFNLRKLVDYYIQESDTYSENKYNKFLDELLYLYTLYNSETTLDKFISNNENEINNHFGITSATYKVNNIIDKNVSKIVPFIFIYNPFCLNINTIYDYYYNYEINMNLRNCTKPIKKQNLWGLPIPNRMSSSYITLYELFLKNDKEILKMKIEGLGLKTIAKQRDIFNDFNSHIDTAKTLYELLKQTKVCNSIEYNNKTGNLEFQVNENTRLLFDNTQCKNGNAVKEIIIYIK